MTSSSRSSNLFRRFLPCCTEDDINLERDETEWKSNSNERRLSPGRRRRRRSSTATCEVSASRAKRNRRISEIRAAVSDSIGRRRKTGTLGPPCRRRPVIPPGLVLPVAATPSRVTSGVAAAAYGDRVQRKRGTTTSRSVSTQYSGSSIGRRETSAKAPANAFPSAGVISSAFSFSSPYILPSGALLSLVSALGIMSNLLLLWGETGEQGPSPLSCFCDAFCAAP